MSAWWFPGLGWTLSSTVVMLGLTLPLYTHAFFHFFLFPSFLTFLLPLTTSVNWNNVLFFLVTESPRLCVHRKNCFSLYKTECVKGKSERERERQQHRKGERLSLTLVTSEENSPFFLYGLGPWLPPCVCWTAEIPEAVISLALWLGFSHRFLAMWGLPEFLS